MSYQPGHIQSDDPNVTKAYDYRTAQACAAHLIPHLKPHFDILDVGCGPGSITRDLAVFCPQGQTLGLDLSPGVVSQAESKYRTEVTNLSFAVGNAEDLSQFADNSFDVVHSHMCLFHLHNPATAFKEYFRVCKPGGIVATRDPAQEWFITDIRPDLPVVREVWPIRYEWIKSMGSVPEVSGYKVKWAKEAGLRDEDIIETESLTYQQTLVNLMAEPHRRLLVEKGLVTEEEAQRYCREWEEWESADEHGFWIKAIEVLCFIRE